jgi:hypothetical protein
MPNPAINRLGNRREPGQLVGQHRQQLPLDFGGQAEVAATAHVWNNDWVIWTSGSFPTPCPGS